MTTNILPTVSLIWQYGNVVICNFGLGYTTFGISKKQLA